MATSISNESWARTLSDEQVAEVIASLALGREGRRAALYVEAARRLREPGRPVKPSIIGRERSLMDKLAKNILADVHKRYPVTDLHEDRRGSHFEVQITVDDEPTGHVARVAIELDRLEEAHDRR